MGFNNTWVVLEKLDLDLIHQLGRINSLPGHLGLLTPNFVTNTVTYWFIGLQR
jgi:hypothetical protein